MKISQNKLFVRQKVEWMEIFTSFEGKNRYVVADEGGKTLWYANEESSFLSRMFMRTHRKLKINIFDDKKNVLLTISRPFFWFRSSYTIREGDKVLGKMKQLRIFFKPKFGVYDADDNLLFTVKSKFFNPWRFPIVDVDEKKELARILKKWSGLGKEIFTDADTFLVEFDKIKDETKKTLLLAAVFAIDLRLFERDESKRVQFDGND